jgi:hypothetical protein
VIRAAREAALATIVAALILLCTVHLRRGDALPVPPSMMTFVAGPPPLDVPSGAMSVHARVGVLDTTVQELRIETRRGAFTAKLGQIVTALGGVPDSAAGEVSAEDVRRLRELVDETVEAIERRIDAQLDDQNVQQHLAGTIYEIRRRMEAIEVWFR